MTGIELIAKERERQVTAEGYTPEHDDEHVDDELALAAISYIEGTNENWPFNVLDFNPAFLNAFQGRAHTRAKDRIKDLAKAGALIAAEIDRLQRLEEKTK